MKLLQIFSRLEKKFKFSPYIQHNIKNISEKNLSIIVTIPLTITSSFSTISKPCLVSANPDKAPAVYAALAVSDKLNGSLLHAQSLTSRLNFIF